MHSNTIVAKVEQRLQSDLRNRFMAPYVDTMALSGPLTPMEILARNRTIEQHAEGTLFLFSYMHPDPVIAAQVSNFFMQEFINYHLTRRSTVI